MILTASMLFKSALGGLAGLTLAVLAVWGWEKFRGRRFKRQGSNQ